MLLTNVLGSQQTHKGIWGCNQVLGRHLKGTQDKGIPLRPDQSRGLEVYVDARFAGDWDQEMSHVSRTARSRHGHIFHHARS